MSMPRLILAMALLVPLCAAAQARAGGASGASQNRDDLTVCCAGFFTPPARMLAAQLFVPQVVGCSAIDGDFKSLNGCQGVVLGCDENAFLCEPSSSNPGAKDCMCAQFNRITPPPPTN